MRALALAAAAIAALIAGPSFAQQEARPQKTVYVDYKGACGGTLVETRRRERIERQAKKIIRRLLAEGYEVKIIVRDESVAYGTLHISGLRSMNSRFPIYNRNFSCGY